MTERYTYTTADLAAELGVNKKTLRRKAAALGLGIDLEGRAGFRYSESDRTRLYESMRPAQPTPRRRRRNVA